jgi:hypothetical protein
MDKNLTTSGNQEIFCSELSLEDNESMAGTASRIDAWFLLEYTGPWLAKAAENNDLPKRVQDWLKEQLALVDKSRLQFIKQDRPKNKSNITFYLALTRKESPRLYQFELDNYEDLLHLNIPALLSGASVFDEYMSADPLFLVCTNGRRDRCCARVGVTLYQVLADRAGDSVWQCTHLGGHRFAPTLVTIPDGSFYGRLAPADVNAFVRSQEFGEFYLSHLRGRCWYDEVTQAAELYLHQNTRMLTRSGYDHLSTEHIEDTLWSVDFYESIGGDVHRLIIRKAMFGSERLVSCSPHKSKPVPQFQMISYELLANSPGSYS